MKSDEIGRRVRESLQLPSPQALRSYRALLEELSLDQRAIAETYMDFALQNRDISDRGALVLAIHGIRTQAPWQESLRAAFAAEPGIKVVPIGYKYFATWKFLLPGPFRWLAVRRVRQEIRNALSLRPETKVVLIAHSFGTYVFARCVKGNPDIKFDGIILCGSVLPENFRWDLMPQRPKDERIVNDVGCSDFLPVAARFFSVGFGCSGTFGFKAAAVRDRFFSYGHSDFFSVEHIGRYWLPFVRDFQVVSSDHEANRSAPPLWVSMAGSFAPLYVIAFAALVVFLWRSR